MSLATEVEKRWTLGLFPGLSFSDKVSLESPAVPDKSRSYVFYQQLVRTTTTLLCDHMPS